MRSHYFQPSLPEIISADEPIEALPIRHRRDIGASTERNSPIRLGLALGISTGGYPGKDD